MRLSRIAGPIKNQCEGDEIRYKPKPNGMSARGEKRRINISVGLTMFRYAEINLHAMYQGLVENTWYLVTLPAGSRFYGTAYPSL